MTECCLGDPAGFSSGVAIDKVDFPQMTSRSAALDCSEHPPKSRTRSRPTSQIVTLDGAKRLPMAYTKLKTTPCSKEEKTPG